MRNDKDILEIKAFLVATGVKSQAQVSALLDSCRSMLALARGVNFGGSSTKVSGSDEVDAYYTRFFMPDIKVQLALKMSPSQLNDSAAHVVSLASAISTELSLGRLSVAQQEKMNGLVTFLMRLAEVVCQKIDDRGMYYQFVDDYRLLVQAYLNSVPPCSPNETHNLFGHFFDFFSPKKKEAAPHDGVKWDEKTAKNVDVDLRDDAGPKGPYSNGF